MPSDNASEKDVPERAGAVRPAGKARGARMTEPISGIGDRNPGVPATQPAGMKRPAQPERDSRRHCEQRDEIAGLLRQRLEELRLRDEAAGRAAPRAVGPSRPRPGGPGFQGWTPAGPAVDVVRLRENLVARYRGRSISEALRAEPVAGRRDLFESRSVVDATVALPAADEALRRLHGSLWLLPGVRATLAARLARAGAGTLADLATHPRFGGDARRVSKLIDRRDAARLMGHVASRASRAHPLALALSAFFEAGDLLFLDIETMGLFGGSPIIMAGLARAVPGAGVEVRQVVASTPAAEVALVREVASAIGRHPALVTFNGRAFDLPYVAARAAFYGTPVVADPVHFDLLGPSRRAWAGKTTDCRLDTLAREVLGMDRGEDVPGSLVPLFYKDFMEDPVGRVGLLAAIADHNRADMEQMVRLFGVLVAWAEGAA